MKVTYRNHIIEAKRDRCMAGYSLLYYSIMFNDYECVCNFEDSAEKTRTMIQHLKGMVDSELEEEYPWGMFEKSDSGDLVLMHE